MTEKIVNDISIILWFDEQQQTKEDIHEVSNSFVIYRWCVSLKAEVKMLLVPQYINIAGLQWIQGIFVRASYLKGT